MKYKILEPYNVFVRSFMLHIVGLFLEIRRYFIAKYSLILWIS